MTSKKKLLIAIVGLPRSGKSTWARKQDLPIVNPDGIRLAIHGERYLAQAEPWIWTFARTMVEALFNAGHDKVILDCTNITHRERDNWKSSNWDIIFHHVETSKEECLARAASTNDTEIAEVIKKMAKRFEPLAPIDPRLKSYKV